MPVYGAAGQTPYPLILKGSASAFLTELHADGLLHRVQSLGEGDNFTSESEEMDYGGSDNDDEESSQRFATQANESNSRKIVNLLIDGEELCKLLDAAVKLDCMADSLANVARSLSSEGDEGNVKRAINDAVEKLDQIVAQNVEPSSNLVQPRVKSNRTNKKTSSRPLRKIAPAKLATANAQATAVIDELSTVLLRSAENSTKRKSYYAKIAQAVDSNKVLLRSA